MVKILSFSTTDKFINLMLQNDKKILFKETIKEKNKHSELLIPSIEKILNKFKLNYKNLNAISTINGPGNFMGLRAGISVVKAIQISTQIPIITLSLFDLISYKENININFLIAIKANLNNYYIEDKNSHKQYILKYEDIANKQNAKILTTDETLSKLDNAKKINFNFNNWAEIIFNKNNNKKFNKDIKALYIRPPKITKRKTKK